MLEKLDDFQFTLPARNVETANLAMKNPRNAAPKHITQQMSKTEHVSRQGTANGPTGNQKHIQLSSQQAVKRVTPVPQRQAATIDGIKIKVKQMTKTTEDEDAVSLENECLDSGMSKLKLAQKYKQPSVQPLQPDQSNSNYVNGLNANGKSPINMKSGQQYMHSTAQASSQNPPKGQEKISVRAYKRSFANILGRTGFQKPPHTLQ